MTQPLVIVTGFRPFLTVSTNPSALLVESLRERCDWADGLDIAAQCVLLDTAYRGLRDRLAALVEKRPAALILTGYSALATGLKIETRATSLCNPDFADASGFIPQPHCDPQETRGNARVDFARLATALKAAGVPATLSDDAGTYVCNNAYWHALDLIARSGAATRAVFVHLPAIEGMADPPEGAGTMTPETMRRGIGVTARELTRDEHLARPG